MSRARTEEQKPEQQQIAKLQHVIVTVIVPVLLVPFA